MSSGAETARTTQIDKPELLAPAGDRACAVAAVENGADAIYFGVRGFNARARATNFALDELPDLLVLLHRRGVRGYVTLNTLAFPGELEDLEVTIRRIAEAGADAAIVQDFGVARLIRAITPDLEVHASTQMSITSAAGARLARDLGCTRAILGRELTLDEIRAIRAEVDLPVEVFVHGALCVSYSGQCLTSEALGGRSANRGECAQACRMPYEIVCDGELRPLGDIKYLLSPQDLAAFDLVPKLVELGVTSLKIEGRLKTPEYVANVTSHYRKAIDEACAGRPVTFSAEDVREMELSFSRGFSHGFFDGRNHKVLVRGDYAKKRGVFLGTVTRISERGVEINLTAPVRRGDGVVFDGDETNGIPEQGGRIYDVRRRSARRTDEAETISSGPAVLEFGRHDLHRSRLRVGQRVWKTDDPELTRRLRRTFEGGPRRLVPLDIRVRAAVGHPLELEARAESGPAARVVSEEPLVEAHNQPATEELFRDQLGRLGGTVYELRDLTVEAEGRPMVPKSLLNALRRDLIERLDCAAETPPVRRIAGESVLPVFRAALRPEIEATSPPELSVLCQHTGQVEAALRAGIERIYLEYHDIRRYKHAIEAVKGHEARIFIATPRIEKPAEANLFRYLTKQGAAGLLVRNAGGLEYCVKAGVPFVADFSLNAANELTVEFLMSRGAELVTPSYDLNHQQLFDLIENVPPSSLETVIHQRIPMFYMEHCVFCAFLSPGTNKTNCGRPCDHHDVKLRDRVGMDHPLKADVGCRNTLYHAVPQSAAEFLPGLLTRGARRFRVEFLDETPDEVTRTIGLYRDALAGRLEPRSIWRRLKATSRYGVTRGPLSTAEAALQVVTL